MNKVATNTEIRQCCYVLSSDRIHKTGCVAMYQVATEYIKQVVLLCTK